MDTIQLSEQLRIAADVLQTGERYDFYSSLSDQWCEAVFGPLHYINTGHVIRRRPLAFPPKPEQFDWQNPDNLTPEQVGEDYRLLIKDELEIGLGRSKDVTWVEGWLRKQWARDCAGDSYGFTYRVPISTPFPDGSFIQDGKMVKPWKLTREIPGFRPLRDGEEWHRQDFTEEMLPEGWRPLLKGERLQNGDSVWIHTDMQKDSGGPHWLAWERGEYCTPDGNPTFWRTRRPLPEPAKPVAWDDTSDFPKVPTIWIRSKNDYRERMVIGFAHPCAIITATCGSSPVLQSIHLTQDGFRDMEWSENRETWLPCHKLP